MEDEVNEPALKYNYISPEEYLEAERAGTQKHEYYRGEVFAMSGASIAHNIIFSNVFGELCVKMKNRECKPLGSDLRVHIPGNTLYTYPDIAIICGKEQLEDTDNLLNPCVIIELLSKSTGNYDKGQKFTLYRDIISLQEYILIDTEKMHIEKHIRNTDNSWLLTEYKNMEDSFFINIVDITIQLKDVYADLSLHQ